jgi:putative ABC transport system permease protein
MEPQPPRWAQRLLQTYCDDSLLEEIEGDLHELFHQRIGSQGIAQARLLYSWDVLRSIPLAMVKRKSLHASSTQYNAMLQNYLTVALRTMLRHKTYSLLNIFGLASGMVVSLLIWLWVQDERNYDRFHSNADQIYRLTAQVSEVEAAITSLPIAPALSTQLPDVQSATRLKDRQELVRIGSRKFEEKRVYYVDSTFFSMFSFPLLEGNWQTALSQPNGVVITRATALKYFGTPRVLGRTVQVLEQTIQTNQWTNLTITGVLDDIPHRSHLQFDLLLPFARLYGTEYFQKNNAWDSFSLFTYVRLADRFEPGSEALAKLEQQINQLHQRQHSQTEAQFHLQPLTDIHLKTKVGMIQDVEGHGNEQYVRIFSVVSLAILLIACINFTNLSTARASRRAKEVGLRKVVGARRGQLIGQFLSESMLYTLLALLVAILLAVWLLPLFNTLTGKQLRLAELGGNLSVGLLVGALLLTSLVAGSYPALYLSGFQPVRVLKGRLASGKATVSRRTLSFRDGLVVVQFVISLVLLVGTAVVYGQLQYIRTRNLGFDKEHLLYVSMPRSGDLFNNTQALKATLSQYPETSRFSITSDLPINLQTGKTNFEWEGKDPNNQTIIPYLLVDERFTGTFGMQLLRGRNFRDDSSADQSNYLVNETALKLMGYELKTAVGKPLVFGDNRGQIIGVIKDFHFKPIHQAIEPLVLRFNRFGGYIVVRADANRTAATVKRLEAIFGSIYPNHPFTYQFLDEDLARLYRAEQQVGHLFKVFAIVALLISCLGLLGLAAFTAEQRRKEIGIRKVLGASVGSIVRLLSRDFLKPVLIAVVLATPVSWWVMNRWLEDFAYRIEVNAWILALAGAVAVGVGLLTVSLQTLKAAVANPVKTLRSE